VTEYKKI